jgi:PAS domain S-box-containing protein
MLRDQRGSPREIVGAVHDITDRKELDEGIWQHEEFLETLLESASKGLFVVDEKSRSVYVTAACQALLGLTTSDWVRDERGLNFHPADAKGAGARFFKALHGSPCRCRTRVKVADGSYQRITIDLSPVNWRGREFVMGIVGGVRNDPRKK